VAFRWRIRHKLMLGLGLVVGLITLLLGGTLYGMASFRANMKSIEGKLNELDKAMAFRLTIKQLEDSINSHAEADKREQQIRQATHELEAYQQTLQETIQREPDSGYEESRLVEKLSKQLRKLEKAVQQDSQHQMVVIGFAGSGTDAADPDIQQAVEPLGRTCDDLVDAINGYLKDSSTTNRRTYQTCLWFVFSTGLVGVLLLCGLLRFFYEWTYDPIRQLEAGAVRLAHGDFEQRIEVHSGDELEDLAGAFNSMTQRLREMYGDLARQVNERSRQLVRSERLASVGFLAAGVAHEINNPLASIAFCSEALEHRLASVLAGNPDNSEVVTKYLKMIQQEAFRCKAITQRLLEFSRGGERRREPIDLAEIIQSVIEMVQHLQNCKGKHIVFDNPGRLVASVNGQEIKSVVLNLVVNALDSMDDGGTLTIALAQRDGMAEIVFRDTGCGMPPEVLENIFEPFFTRSRTGKGTGLGLSISHRIISQHGGEIEATSRGLNQGSTFTARLPLQPAESVVKEETLGHAAA
jgi:signal transduction histidine kinase